MASHPAFGPGYSALRSHRWSTEGAEYFTTVSAQRPTSALIEPNTLATIQSEFRRLEQEGAWSIRTAVVMPDHIHLLFVLGTSHNLAGTIRLLKGRSAAALRASNAHWQDGYYEHRMRAEDDRLPVFLYIFLNPYREKLLPANETWRGYQCAPADWQWFAPLTNSETPFPEWLA